MKDDLCLAPKVYQLLLTLISTCPALQLHYSCIILSHKFNVYDLMFLFFLNDSCIPVHSVNGDHHITSDLEVLVILTSNLPIKTKQSIMILV